MTGVKKSRIFAAASATRRIAKKINILRDFNICSLRQANNKSSLEGDRIIMRRSGAEVWRVDSGSSNAEAGSGQDGSSEVLIKDEIEWVILYKDTDQWIRGWRLEIRQLKEDRQKKTTDKYRL